MGLDFEKLSPEELLAAESAVLTMRSLLDAVKTAPQGRGMFCLETVIHDKGFEHLRKMLQTAAASHDGAQKKGTGVCLAPAEKTARSDGAIPSRSLSSLGSIEVARRYYACRHCRAKQTPWETWAGLAGPHRVTPHARRMIVLAGSGCSFDEASRNLVELAHVQVSNDLVRALCDEEGQAAQQWMSQSPEPKKVFAAAEGVVEFSTDGLKINTVDGWREIRPSVFSKRKPGLSVPADQWDERTLEPPTARVAVCGIAHCDRIGASWQRLVKLLGLPKDVDMSVIADGAADHREHRDHDDVVKLMNLVPAPRIGKVVKEAQKTAGRSDVHVKLLQIDSDWIKRSPSPANQQDL